MATPGIVEFKQKLSELKSKSAKKINELTALAEKHVNEAFDMVSVWDAEIKSTTEEKRYQALFALADSILKKNKAAYKNAFGYYS